MPQATSHTDHCYYRSGSQITTAPQELLPGGQRLTRSLDTHLAVTPGGEQDDGQSRSPPDDPGHPLADTTDHQHKGEPGNNSQPLMSPHAELFLSGIKSSVSHCSCTRILSAQFNIEEQDSNEDGCHQHRPPLLRDSRQFKWQLSLHYGKERKVTGSSDRGSY